jgi:hypothetical protein
MWFKLESACLASVRSWVQTPAQQKMGRKIVQQNWKKTDNPLDRMNKNKKGKILKCEIFPSL